MTTIGSIMPKREREKRDADGFCIGKHIQIDADREWSDIGLNIFGGKHVIGIGLDEESIDKLINLLQEGKKIMRKR